LIYLSLFPLSISSSNFFLSNSDADVDDDFANDQVHEELGDDVIESSTLISPIVILVITELVNVFPKDVTHKGIS